MTPLHAAAVQARDDVAELLISKGASIDLHIAAGLGDVKRTEALIAGGVDVNAQDASGWTPLHWASFGGYFGVVKYSITMGADAQAKTEEIAKSIYADSTAGDIAVERDYPDIVKFLNRLLKP